jgi:hypothetical protein
VKSNPTPAFVFINDPSKYMVHILACIGVVDSWVLVHSARKSAKIWYLIAFLGVNDRVSPMSLTAHLATLPEASLF